MVGWHGEGKTVLLFEPHDTTDLWTSCAHMASRWIYKLVPSAGGDMLIFISYTRNGTLGCYKTTYHWAGGRDVRYLKLQNPPLNPNRHFERAPLSTDDLSTKPFTISAPHPALPPIPSHPPPPPLSPVSHGLDQDRFILTDGHLSGCHGGVVDGQGVVAVHTDRRNAVRRPSSSDTVAAVLLAGGSRDGVPVVTTVGREGRWMGG